MNLNELASFDATGRLMNRLRSIETGSRSGADLVALVRSLCVSRAYTAVVVPLGKVWPSQAEWEAASFAVEQVDGADDHLSVRPNPWSPRWADGGVPPDAAPAKRERRRSTEALPADPFLEEASGGMRSYRSDGQRDAVRAVLSSPPVATVLAVLPTGAGKTLVASVAGYLAKPDLTVVVVPTVSLALDLERRFQNDYGIATPVAYHGDLEAEAKVALRGRVASGEQWVLITSPEALLASLATTIYERARAGRLANFVIDEAHIVATWGDSFRPAFQALAGYRRELSVAAQTAGRDFRTILLTGTLDTFGMKVLSTLFSSGELSVISAQVTRPEPSYWRSRCVDDQEKRVDLIDAIRHLPRPALVYTSLVNGRQGVRAQDIAKWFEEARIGRFAMVTGSTKRSERESVVRRLRGESGPAGIDDAVDIVIASSAFGLGVDIDGVRSVVHACIPESIDRYYQEVGRGGRDGLASLSLVIHSPSDRRVASALASTDDIGAEKAWERWESMRATAEPTAEGVVVSLTAVRDPGQNPSSDLNRKWNLHTLTLMELAGMIETGWSAAPPPGEDLSEDEVLEHFEKEFQNLPVRIRQGDIGEETFKQRLERARGKGADASKRALHAVFGLLELNSTCHNGVFAKSFELDMRNDDRVMTRRICGGCPACRSRGLTFSLADETRHFPYWAAVPKPTPRKLAGLFGNLSVCGVAVTRGADLPEMRASFVLRLLSSGAELLVLPTADAEDVRHRLSHAHARWFGVESLDDWVSRLDIPPLVTVVVVPDGAQDHVVRELIARQSHGVPLIIIHDSELRVPGTKHFLREVLNSLPVGDAMRAV